MVAQTQVYAAYGEGMYGSDAYGVSTSTTPTGSSSASSGTSGASTSNPQSCNSLPPEGVPDLFQINSQLESLTLFFAPVSGNRDRYFVSYSTEPSAEQHGFEFVNQANGVIAVDVKALQPNTEYYFKVRAGNGCQPGEWSNELAARTGQWYPTYRWSSYPRIVATGVIQTINPSAISPIEVDASSIETSPTQPRQQSPTSGAKPQESALPSPTPTKQGGIWQWLMNLFR